MRERPGRWFRLCVSPRHILVESATRLASFLERVLQKQVRSWFSGMVRMRAEGAPRDQRLLAVGLQADFECLFLIDQQVIQCVSVSVCG